MPLSGNLLPETLPRSLPVAPPILYVGTPVVLVSTRNVDGSTNLAPFSSLWFLETTGMLGIGTRSHTFANLRREGECVLNLPEDVMAAAVNRLAWTTGSSPVPSHKQAKGFVHVRDKFAHAGLTPGASDLVAPPRVLECPLQIEANVERCLSVGEPGDHIGAVEFRVLRTHAHETVLTPGQPDRIAAERWRPLIMSFLKFYGLGAVPVHGSRLADRFLD